MYLFSHPTLPLPIPGRELERLLPHRGGGWVGVSSYILFYLFSHPTLPLPILGRELDRLLPHRGGGWVGVSRYSAIHPCRDPLCN